MESEIASTAPISQPSQYITATTRQTIPANNIHIQSLWLHHLGHLIIFLYGQTILTIFAPKNWFSQFRFVMQVNTTFEKTKLSFKVSMNAYGEKCSESERGCGKFTDHCTMFNIYFSCFVRPLGVGWFSESAFIWNNLCIRSVWVITCSDDISPLKTS